MVIVYPLLNELLIKCDHSVFAYNVCRNNICLANTRLDFIDVLLFPLQKQLQIFFQGYSKSNMIVAPWKSCFMLICRMNTRIHLVTLSCYMQKLYNNVFLSSYV